MSEKTLTRMELSEAVFREVHDHLGASRRNAAACPCRTTC